MLPVDRSPGVSPEVALLYISAPVSVEEHSKHISVYKSKTHKGLNRTLFNQTKQDRLEIFERILFLKATNNTKTNKQLLPIGFFQKDV